jgi:hypothetical protein
LDEDQHRREAIAHAQRYFTQHELEDILETVYRDAEVDAQVLQDKEEMQRQLVDSVKVRLTEWHQD